MSIKARDRAQIEELIAAGASLAGIDAAGAQLQGIDLSGQDLSGARLRYADLSQANLQGTLLRGANLRHARLLGADLRYADLSGADISHADLHGVILGETKLLGVRAKGVQGVRREVFFPEPLLKSLLQRSGVELGEEQLIIAGPPKETFRIEPAVRIVEREDGERDRWIGKVVTEQELRRLGGEADEGYLLLEGHSYRVEVGYLGRPEGAPEEPRDESGSETGSTGQSDLDLLTAFLKEKLA